MISEAFVLQEHVLPGLDVLQLERIALETELLERVFGDEVAQAEAKVLADRNELQRVFLELPAHDDNLPCSTLV